MTYWKQIAIAFLVAIVFSVGYYKGYSNQKEKFEAFKLQVEVNARVQQEKNQLLIKQQTKVTETITKDYEDAIKKLSAHNATHRLYNRSSSSRVSKVPETSSGVNEESKSDLSSTIGDCSLDVVQLLYLQKWIEEQEETNF